MPMKILILEDNPERRAAMAECLADRFYTYAPVFFHEPQSMLCYLRDHLDEAICISLDHDMDLIEDAAGQLSDPGTGREVADYLATRSPRCPVVIHTTNTVAADGMEAVLTEVGWIVYRVSPWGDLEWVRAVWFRAVRRAIVDAAVTTHPSASGTDEPRRAASSS